ncbi:alpha/beta hydrolase [Consotaella aegiceratis]|uniref:alpha/beta hydrolase n=1 Tax=Consotaella aegiceratis TaxID=3097961 RepID=UPI002F3FE101
MIKERSPILFKANREISGIVRPSLTVVLPPRPNGTALIIAPGGGYSRIALDKEGLETAEALGPIGVTVFLLSYRLPAEGHADGRYVPLQDGQRAMRLVRHHAEAWGLDPKRIGLMGFSAGGHLAASVVTGHDKAVYDPVDEADRQSARPDFAGLIYPVVSMVDGVAHPGSRTSLIGPDPDAELIREHSPDRHVGPETTETFLVLADDDPAVPAENSVLFYSALRRAGVPAELHIFRDGGHGFGIAEAAHLPIGGWPELFRRWLGRIGVISA